MILSFAATTAEPTPSVGAVRVRIRFCVPEKTAPQAVAVADAASVSVLSKPVEAPCVKVTVLIVLLVKLKGVVPVEGKVIIIVSVESPAPVGVVNLILWLEAVVAFELDIVSDALVIAAALATCVNGPAKIDNIETTNNALITLLKFFILYFFNLYKRWVIIPV